MELKLQAESLDEDSGASLEQEALRRRIPLYEILSIGKIHAPYPRPEAMLVLYRHPSPFIYDEERDVRCESSSVLAGRGQMIC